jgi:hypothetical protein
VLRGIIIAYWDESKGMRTIVHYPQNVIISEANLIQLYALHVNSKNETPTLLETTFDDAKYLSYRSGPDQRYFFILVSDPNENANMYEDGFIESLQLIIQNLDNNVYMDNMDRFFENIERYYLLNDEQKLSWLFQNDLRRIILDILRKAAVIEKKRLVAKVTESYSGEFFDIEPILMSLEKSGIIRLESIKESIYIFFVEDMIFERIPPVDQHETIDSRGLPSKLKKSYQREVDKFFSGYKPSEEDALDIIEKVILDPQIYECLKLLRVACITRADFEVLAAKGVRDVDYILKTLWETNMILVLQGDKNIEYYCLKSDFYVKPFFPSYLLNIIKIVYQNKMENPVALIRAIQILKTMYNELYISLKARTDKNKKEIEEDIFLNY